ncbi:MULTISPECIES: DNA alkylation repair protein [Gordonia]|uniref:DNA alkylation repair protein n=1 Tax=Gordonia TaxID=2053 RepID=UPI0033972F72
MTRSTDIEPTLTEVLGELRALDDPRIRAVNERHGDDHGVNLTKLRATAKRLRTQPELAAALWATGDTAARLLALLICRPKAFDAVALDTMVREADRPKVHDWFVNYVVKKSAHVEELRTSWMNDPDPVVAAAGWALTSDRVAKRPDDLDLTALLDTIESQMAEAPPRLQWAMNTCLATIGIESPDSRSRAVDIGKRLRVLEDYPTSPDCTSPYAPVWIAEMVRRRAV